ncbi:MULTISPECIES: PEP-CTERM sorting domain-containing protein [unclassified Moorena]|uniref:PEP-CTERM sorting domain-containing protein n=1 Tax=unclassified Moorena TaxID=2683338 RepID=UPI0013FE4F33|nr:MULTISPECIES: PEP-CTERM sorting domain-containing protein [unclassified Moorena]NEO17763.1 PEP-CTERM sorting domain-containing protein [Moorena sp. SIO3E8]NEQ04325.1 PEP-CTERM sorting domain-containing protein [Moorena sp. SIO3F7]
MMTRNLLLSLGVSALGLAFTPFGASAFTIVGDLSETEFQNLAPEISLSAESRFGSGTIGGNTFELDIHKVNASGGFTNLDQKEFNWVSGEAVDFLLEFDGISQLTYTVGDVVLSSTVTEDNFSDLFLRTSARKDNSSIVLSNLMLTDSAMSASLPDASNVCSNPNDCGFFDAQYLHISNVLGAFSLTGQSTMTWSEENRPTQSRLAYQVKLVAGEPGDKPPVDVPEPATMSVFSLGVIGLVLTGSRRRHQLGVQQ